MNTGENLHQCALAGAVFADEPVDLTRQEFEIDPIERRAPPKRLVTPCRARMWLRRRHDLNRRRRRAWSDCGVRGRVMQPSVSPRLPHVPFDLT